jgi:hypothetical protein
MWVKIIHVRSVIFSKRRYTIFFNLLLQPTKYRWKQTMSIRTVGSFKMGQLGQNNLNTHICNFLQSNLVAIYGTVMNGFSLLHVSRLAVLGLGWHAQAACLSNHQSLTTAMEGKNLCHWAKEQQNWAKMFESGKFELVWSLVLNTMICFMLHLEITPTFSENLERNLWM